MSIRVCACGEPIRKLLSRSNVCDACKAKQEVLKRDQARQKRIAEATQNGLTLVHSCVVEHDLIVNPPDCHCNKFLSFEKARQFVKDGDACDWETRKPIFVQGRSLLLTGRRLTPGRATLSGRVTIERRGEDAGYSDDDIKRLQAIAVEDRALRHLERLRQADVEHELEREARKRIIVTVPAEEFDRREDEDYGRPGIFVNGDSRTAGGIGVNVIIHDVAQNDCDEEDAALAA